MPGSNKKAINFIWKNETIMDFRLLSEEISARRYPGWLYTTMGLPAYTTWIICSSGVQLTEDQVYTQFACGKEEEWEVGLLDFIWG